MYNTLIHYLYENVFMGIVTIFYEYTLTSNVTVHLNKLFFLIIIKPLYRTQTRKHNICVNRNI